MNANSDDFIQGAAQVVDYYGYWPSFHDAQIVEVNFDCLANTASVSFTLNEPIGNSDEYALSSLTLDWEAITELCFKADYAESASNWLWEANFDRRETSVHTELLSNYGIGATITSRSVRVTHFEPRPENHEASNTAPD